MEQVWELKKINEPRSGSVRPVPNPPSLVVRVLLESSSLLDNGGVFLVLVEDDFFFK